MEIKIPTLPQKAREGWGTRGPSEGRLKLQFEVNGQQYFLAFVEDERRWYVFAPAVEGTIRIPVYVDAPKYDYMGISEKSPSRVLS
jgi:hypothetical protein